MQIKASKNQVSDPTQFLRRCGYGMLTSRKTGQTSFVRRLDRDLYPRFHLYAEDEGERWSFNLHLDQRAPVYAGVTAHAGEYDGETVEREGERIRQMLGGALEQVSGAAPKQKPDTLLWG